MEPTAETEQSETGQAETLAEMAARIKGQVLAGISGDRSPEQIHRLAEMVRELHRVEALMAAEGQRPARRAGDAAEGHGG